MDSVRLLAMELQQKLEHIRNRLQAYPIFIDMDSADFPKRQAERKPSAPIAAKDSDRKSNGAVPVVKPTAEQIAYYSDSVRRAKLAATDSSRNANTAYYQKLLAAGVFYRDAADHIAKNVETFILPMLY